MGAVRWQRCGQSQRLGLNPCELDCFPPQLADCGWWLGQALALPLLAFCVVLSASRAGRVRA